MSDSKDSEAYTIKITPKTQQSGTECFRQARKHTQHWFACFVGLAIFTELCFVKYTLFLCFLIDDGTVSKVLYLLTKFITHTNWKNYALTSYIHNEQGKLNNVAKIR